MPLQPNGNPLSFAVDGLFGVVLLSTIIGACLFGILTVQCYSYYFRFIKDPTWLKSLVAVLWILDLTHTITTAAWAYTTMIESFSHPERVTLFALLGSISLQLGPVIALIVQLFFARRHWVLNNQKYFPSAAIVAIALVAFGCGTATVARTYHLHSYAESAKLTKLLVVWLASSVLTDVLVTSAITWSLWSKKTGARETERFVSRIIVWTINTALLTTVVAIVDLAFFLTSPRTRIHVALNYLLAKLYSNTLMASLNRRGRDGKTLRHVGAFEMSAVHEESDRSGDQDRDHWSTGRISTKVDVTVVNVTDADRHTLADTQASTERLNGRLVFV